MDWYKDENGNAQYNKDITKDNFGSSGIKGTYIGKSGGGASSDGNQYDLNADGTKTPHDVATITGDKKSDSKSNATFATEIPARIIISESLKRIAGNVGLVISRSLIFVNLIFTVSGDTRIKQDEMSKGSSKNERKSNPDAKSSAQQKVNELEQKLNNAKTNAEKNEIKRQLTHWRGKANSKSEPHSRNSNRH